MRRENRLKHVVALLEQAERDIKEEKRINTPYLLEVLNLILDQEASDRLLRREIVFLQSRGPVSLRSLNAIRHLLLVHLGKEPADWNMLLPSGNPDPSHREVLPIRLFLEDIRSPFNVGAIFRTAESFGVAELLLSPGSASPTHPRAVRSAMGCIEALPWSVAPIEELPQDVKIFALETGGTPLPEFSFPKNGVMVLGSEELGISPAAKERACLSSGLVSIPMGGLKKSLNVSVACGIALYHWYTRLGSSGEGLPRSQAD